MEFVVNLQKQQCSFYIIILKIERINNLKTLNHIPIDQRLHVLKEIKNNIKVTLHSSIEVNKTSNTALKRSTSAQPSEKDSEKKINKMVKYILYLHQIKHKQIIKQQHLNINNNNSSE